VLKDLARELGMQRGLRNNRLKLN